MSEYFRVLKRLEEAQHPGGTRPLEVVAAAPATPGDLADNSTSAHQRLDSPPPRSGGGPGRGPNVAGARAIFAAPSLTPSTPLGAGLPRCAGEGNAAAAGRPAGTSADAQAVAYGTLLDSLRALAAGHSVPRVIVAAAAGENIRPIVDGLSSQARRLGLAVCVATLAGESGQRRLQMRDDPDAPLRPGAPDDLPLDLRSRATLPAAGAWLDRLAAQSDLVLVEAPPLADSIDAALLACASDGLVIAGHTEVTLRRDLRAAAERARIAGCRVLGMVLHDTREHLPHWLRELGGHRRRRETQAS